MIFTKKNYKISSGTNPSIFAKSDTEFEFYVFDKSVSKYIFTLSDTLKCASTNLKYPYNHVCRLSNNYLCVCFDDNISVINEEN